MHIFTDQLAHHSRGYLCECKGKDEGCQCEHEGFCKISPENAALLGAEQPSCCHFPGPESGLGHSQGDVVEECKHQQKYSGCYEQTYVVFLYHAFKRSGSRDKTEMYIFERGEDVFMEHIIDIQHIILLDCLFQPCVEALDICPRDQPVESDGDTVAVAHPRRIHFAEKVKPVDYVLRREYRIAEVLVDGAYCHAFLGSVEFQDKALSDRILVLEMALCEAFRYRY